MSDAGMVESVAEVLWRSIFKAGQTHETWLDLPVAYRERIKGHARAAIAAHLAALEEEGMVVVPREPTRGMVFCGVAGLYETDDPEEEAETLWQAMIAAAPKEES